LSIHEYSRATGVSARMLIHYFTTKSKLDSAVIAAIDASLREQAGILANSLGGLAAAEELVRGFKKSESERVRALFRALLAKAFAGDRSAIVALLEERERWKTLFRAVLKNKTEVDRTVRLLQGAALDAILDDMSSENRSTRRRRTSAS
jgi:hypothetical protein